MERHVFSGSVVCRRSFDGVGCHLSFALELKINPRGTFHQSTSSSCMPELKDIKANLSPTCPALPEGFLHCFLCCFMNVQHPLNPCSPKHDPLWSLLQTFLCAVFNGWARQFPEPLPPCWEPCLHSKTELWGHRNCAHLHAQGYSRLDPAFSKPHELPHSARRRFLLAFTSKRRFTLCLSQQRAIDSKFNIAKKCF